MIRIAICDDDVMHRQLIHHLLISIFIHTTQQPIYMNLLRARRF